MSLGCVSFSRMRNYRSAPNTAFIPLTVLASLPPAPWEQVLDTRSRCECRGEGHSQSSRDATLGAPKRRGPGEERKFLSARARVSWPWCRGRHDGTECG